MNRLPELDGECILAACPLTADADSINHMFEKGFRVIVAKTVTAEPKRFEHKFGYRNTLRIGNGSMLNAIGMANRGCEAAARDLRRVAKDVCVVQSIHGSAPEEYDRIIPAFDSVPCVSAYEVNVSCPNIYGSACGGEQPDVIKRIKGLTKKPVLVKISHRQAATPFAANEYAENGAAYITAINSIPAAYPDDDSRICEGGLSGSAIKPIALRAVYHLARSCRVPIIGCGGIRSSTDAAEFRKAGARAVQMATGVMLKEGWGTDDSPVS